MRLRDFPRADWLSFILGFYLNKGLENSVFIMPGVGNFIQDLTKMTPKVI